MVLVIPTPTGIPNALNPTTAAVERDAEKREITPAVTPDNASASTADSTEEKDLFNYTSKKDDSEDKKNQSSASPASADDTDVTENTTEYVDVIVEEHDEVALAVDMTRPPEMIIAEILLIRQAILGKSTITVNDRQQLAEINYIIKTALADLLRLKELDEVKELASRLPHSTGVLKGTDVHSDVVALDDLFAYSFDEVTTASSVSAKSKLAGAVVGNFYGENIEPQPPSHIDHQE